jgi:hypothetical protein
MPRKKSCLGSGAEMKLENLRCLKVGGTLIGPVEMVEGWAAAEV